MKVLIAEDDLNIQRALVEILEGEGYVVAAASDGEALMALFAGGHYDFVCLDIMMPKKSGYDCCREIREAGSNVPIIFLSAKSEEIDKVVGLELGADDFVMKPFGKKELVARVRAVSRRCLREKSPTPELFVMDDIEVSPKELRARRGDETIELSLREVHILELFMRKKGEVVDRDTLFSACWEGTRYPNSRTLDQHISKLRRKIERDPKSPQIIKTVHGVGYRYEASEGS